MWRINESKSRKVYKMSSLCLVVCRCGAQIAILIKPYALCAESGVGVTARKSRSSSSRVSPTIGQSSFIAEP